MEKISEIQIDVEKARRIIVKLIGIEHENIRTKKHSKSDMIRKIKALIEEEVECF